MRSSSSPSIHSSKTENQAADGLWGMVAALESFANILGEEGQEQSQVMSEFRAQVQQRAEAYIDPEERNDFYQRLQGLIAVFFGIEHQPEEATVRRIAVLINQVFDDVKHLMKLDGTEMTLRGIQSKVQNAISHQAPTESIYNLPKLLDKLYGDFVFLPKNVLIQSIQNEQMPDQIRKPFNELLKAFRSDQVPRAAIKNSLSKYTKTDQNPTENANLKRLRQVNAFLNSLSGHWKIDEVMLVDLLRDQASADDVLRALNPSPNSLQEAFLRSSLDGKHLVADPLISTKKHESLAKSLFGAMYSQDFQSMITMLMGLATKDLEIKQITLRTGIGGTEDDVPLRLVSYLICSLEIARRLQERYGESPRIELFTGQEGAIACNEFNPERVRENTALAFSASQQFVNTLYPEVADKFALVADDPWEGNESILMMVDYLESLLVEAVATGDAMLQRIIEQLMARGEAHNVRDGRRGVLRYAAFHAICFRDIPYVNQYLGHDQKDYQHVISVGGLAEKEFDYIRHILKRRFVPEGFSAFAAQKGHKVLVPQLNFSDAPRHASIITGTGINPPYYLDRKGGDMSLQELAGKNPAEVHGQIAQRILTVLEQQRHQSQPNNPFLQGMALISAVSTPEQLARFVHQLLSSSNPVV